MSRSKDNLLKPALLGAALLSGLWACGSKDSTAKPAPEPSAEPAGAPVAMSPTSPAPEGGKYEVVEVKDGGSVSGTVKWSGKKPEKKMLEITKDEPTCAKHGKQVPSEELIVSDSMCVKNALVSLDVKKGAAFAPTEDLVFDQKDCHFLSHVFVVPVGATIKVKNSDDVLHNTHFNAVKNRGENKAVPAGDIQEYKVTATETIKVNCDIHPWMGAWVVVRDNPYYALTDENGNFSVKNVPPGKYKITVWQEVTGRGAPQDIEVKAGADTKTNLEVKPK